MIIQQEGYEVTLLRKRIKNLNLRINTTGKVVLSAPLKCPLPFIQAYLQEKHDWIHFHHKRFLAQGRIPPLSFKTGETHFFLGKAYTLTVQEELTPKRIVVDVSQIHLFVKKKATVQEKQAQLNAWYRTQFKQFLPNLIRKWEPIINVQVNHWGIKSMKTRWGSCNIREKRVWLNLLLIQKNMGCIEYVLVHEMVHLLEPSHNKRFYTLMTQFMPNWKDYKKQLSSPLAQEC